MNKIGWVIGVVVAVLITYFVITAFWSGLMVESIDYAANATDNTTYPFAHWGITTMPIWLYITPAACGIIAIVWKLRQKG